MYAQGVAIQSHQLQPVTVQSKDPFYDDQPGAVSQFTYVTPTPDQVQQEPNTRQYDGALDAPTAIEASVLNQRPTAPSLLYIGSNKTTYGMPLRYISVISELHVATAFVRMKIVYQYTGTAKKVSSIFVLPTKGTVTSCQVNLGGNRWLDTSFISKDDQQKLAKKQKKKAAKKQVMLKYY